MPLRLLTVGSLSPEWGGPARGGVATFHAALLAGLRSANEEIEVIGVFSPAPLERQAPVPVFERPPDVPIAAFYEELLERLRPDVVLMNHVAHTVGVTHARLAARPPAVGVAHSWHNITYAPPEDVEQRREVTVEALGGLAVLVTGSRHALEEGRQLGLRYPPFAETIHYPLQPIYLDLDLDVSRERRGVLFLGSLIPRKNPGSLIEAATRLPGVPVVLAGEGELDSALRALVTDLGLAGRVSLVGHVPPAEHLHRIRDLLLGAETMCLPSRSESFGLAYIEALACGTPVVGFGPTVREIRDAMGIEIGEALGDDASPEEIAAAIERVTATSWDRELLRRAAISAFGLSRVSERYAELLRRTALESSTA